MSNECRHILRHDFATEDFSGQWQIDASHGRIAMLRYATIGYRTWRGVGVNLALSALAYQLGGNIELPGSGRDAVFARLTGPWSSAFLTVY